MELLNWIQNWFYKQCNGDWEHENRISITTIDNPGWHVAINLLETELEKKIMKLVKFERSEDDWFFCKVENGVFSGAGGPMNLQEILQIFYNWAKSQEVTDFNEKSK